MPLPISAFASYRDRYIHSETEDFAAELRSSGGDAGWKRLQLEGAEQAADERFDEAMALFVSHADTDAGFDAVCAAYDEDLAQAVDQTVNWAYPVRAPMTPEQLAAHDAAIKALAAEQAEELSARRAA